MSGGTGFLLLAAAAGYWVLEHAVSHKGRLKQVGQLVGSVIIAVSLIGVACKVWYVIACNTGFCPWGAGSKTFCPYTPKGSAPGSSSPSK